MVIIGFLALLAAGGYLVFAGVSLLWINLNFLGKVGFGWIIPVILGAVLIYVAIIGSPITIQIK